MYFPRFALLTLFACHRAQASCKTTPLDANWPSPEDWRTLNASIGGALIRTVPAGSGCYPGNPLGSFIPCDAVEKGWTDTEFHAELPESVDYPLFANYTCVPPNQVGYANGSTCRSVGAYPAYVVNSTEGHDIARSMAWAAKRNLRIVVKGTGHEYNGRSTGAHSLSIWTHHLTNIELISWKGEDAVVIGSGWRYGDAYEVISRHGFTLVSGGSGSVGLGGHIQGGGHGPYSSHYGLAADQIFQVTVATTSGKLLVANEDQNQDLLFAIRGGGGGQYGVVTEYVLKLYPLPKSSSTGQLTMYSASNSTDNNNTWTAFAALMSELPSVMDDGIAGSLIAATGSNAMSYIPALNSPPAGVVFIAQPIAYNTTAEAMDEQMESLRARIIASYGHDSSITLTWSGATTTNTSRSTSSPDVSADVAGGGNVMSSRLLGRTELSLPLETLASHLRSIMYTPTNSALVIAGLQGGKGVANVPNHMRGAVNPVWRSTYLHVMSYTVPLNESLAPKEGLAQAAEWAEQHIESAWRKWAPDTGSYMNEGNPFNSHWKHDFYGVHYEKLLGIKRKYDPSESLFVLTGVGSDEWEYDLDSGKLCRVCSSHSALE